MWKPCTLIEPKTMSCCISKLQLYTHFDDSTIFLFNPINRDLWCIHDLCCHSYPILVDNKQYICYVLYVYSGCTYLLY